VHAVSTSRRGDRGRGAGALTPARACGSSGPVRADVEARRPRRGRSAGDGRRAAEKLLVDYPKVSLAGFLSPRQTVIAGSVAQVDAAINAVSAQERFARRVNMEVASHTADGLHPARIAFGASRSDAPSRRRFRLSPPSPTRPRRRSWTPTTGANVRQPVRLHQAISVAAEQHATFIEISPHPTLTHAVTERWSRCTSQRWDIVAQGR